MAKKTRRVAIMLDLEWLYAHHTGVFAGTQQFARERGNWQCFVDEYVDQRLPASRGKSMPYDGIVARATAALARKARACRIPVVNVWMNSPVADALPGVFPDMRRGGQLVGKHVLDRGFRRFACLSSRGDRAEAELVAGFHEVIEAEGYACRCARCNRDHARNHRTWRAFQQALEAWIDSWEPPLAIFVASVDITARHVVTACQRRGLRVPEDVAVVAGVNEPAVCQYPPPKLTGINVGWERVGYAAAELLERLMNGERAPDEVIRVRPNDVVGRQSTDFFAVDDDAVAAAMRFISEHLEQDIDVDAVARGVSVSRRTLERRFHDHLQRGIHEEIVRLRTLKARRMLVETEVPVKQIALMTGFSDSFRMREAFLRELGVTPQALRDQPEDGLAT